MKQNTNQEAKKEPEKRKPSIPAERRAATEAIRKLAKGISLGGLRIKDLINEGRP